MKRFLYKFLVCILSMGMIYPTWLATGAEKANAASSEIIVDNSAAAPEFSKTGDWTLNSNASGYGGNFYVEKDDSDPADPARTAIWQPDITVAGVYQVYLHWSARDNRGVAVGYQINYLNGSDGLVIDQRKKADGSDAGNTAVASGWKLVGSYYFGLGTGGNVSMVESAVGRTSADAVKFVHANVMPSAPALQTPSDGTVTRQTTVDFSWLASIDSDDPLLKYDFELYKDTVLDAVNSESGISTTNKQVIGLAEGVYKWRTRAFDGESYSVWSGFNNFSIDLTTPDALTGLIATAGNGEVSLSWNSANNAEYYNIYYQKSTASSYTGPIATTLLSTKVTGLENGVLYRFIVRSARVVGGKVIESANAWLEATPVAPKVVLASAPLAVAVAPAAPAPEPTVTTPEAEEPQEVGKIKGEEQSSSEEESINWTPWIILFVLIVLAGAATGGYFYWFGNEEEEIVTEETIEKSRKGAAKKPNTKKTSTKKDRRW